MVNKKDPLELEDNDGPPPREKKSDSPCCKCKMTLPRTVWLILTLIVLGGFVYHFSIQIMKYLSYPVNLNTVKINDYTMFPDITACPATYFSKFRNEHYEVYPEEKKRYIDTYFLQNLALLWNMVLFNKSTGSTYQQAFEYILPARFTLMQHFAASHVSPSFGDSLIECEYSADNCDFSRIKSFFHPSYGLCFTFTPANDTLVDSTLSSGLQMTMAYRDRVYFDLVAATRNLVPGATIFLHRRNSFPDMEYPLQSISYGMMLSIDFSYSKINRLFTPKVACEQEKQYEFCRVEPFNRRKCRNYTESPFTRQLQNRQMELSKHCDCVSEEWPIPAFLKDKQSCHYMPDLAFAHRGFQVYDNGTILLLHPDGGNKTVPLKDIVDLNKVRKRYKCYIRIRGEMVKYTSEKRLCVVEDYKYTLNYAPHWTNLNTRYSPFRTTKTRLGVHISEAIKLNQPQREANNISSLFYIKVDGGKDNIDVGSFTSPLAMYRSYATESSRVYVYSSEARSYIKQEAYLYDTMFFIADTGGVLGLWVGFSLLSILDIIEVAIVRYRRKRAAKNELEST